MIKNAILLMLFISLIGIISCDEKIEDITENLIGTFSCTVNNNSWKATIIAGSEQNDNLIITAKKDKELITLNFDTLKVGKYQIDLSNNAIYTCNIDSLTETTYTATVGEIELTSVDRENKRISGNFHFEGFNTTMSKVTVTSGVFKNIIFQ